MGCRNCELACSYYKSNGFNKDDANIKVELYPSERIIVTQVCMQCESAPCIDVCPTRALTRDEKTNAVKLNKDKCIGCKACVQVCPFGSIEFSTMTRAIHKCDLCDGDPKCVNFCQANALEFIDISKVALQRRKQMFKII